jgi:glycosyltransferase involved in cell wall biosynthesis
VSVVIPARNVAPYIGAAITSALEQTAPPFEIIVVDDGSTDDTHSVVDRWNGKGHHSRVLVRYLYVPPAGPALARNTGIRVARGSHIAFLDADDIWLPDKLERQLALLGADPDLCLVYTGAALTDEKGTILKAISCQPACAGRQAAAVLRIKNCIQISTVLASRSGLLRAGLFDPSLPSCENWDLWIRLARQGAVAFVDAALVKYRMRTGSRITDVSRMKDARLQVLARHHPDRRSRERRLAYALAYLDSGIGYIEAGNRVAAAADLFRSLWIRPAPGPVIELVRAGLPPSARHALGRLRRAWHGRC